MSNQYLLKFIAIMVLLSSVIVSALHDVPLEKARLYYCEPLACPEVTSDHWYLVVDDPNWVAPPDVVVTKPEGLNVQYVSPPSEYDRNAFDKQMWKVSRKHGNSQIFDYDPNKGGWVALSNDLNPIALNADEKDIITAALVDLAPSELDMEVYEPPIVASAGSPAVPSTIPQDGYTTLSECFEKHDDCKQMLNGRFLPPGAAPTAKAARPGEAGVKNPCEGVSSCFMFKDPSTGEMRFVKRSDECPQGQCASSGSAVAYQDKKGKTDYSASFSGTCVDKDKGKSCYEYKDSGGLPRYYYCTEDSKLCQAAQPVANPAEIAQKTRYWTPPSPDYCTKAGGRMVGDSGVCQVIGDCPNKGYVYSPSCSESLTEEQSYAKYVNDMKSQARLSSLMEAGAVGRAWGQVFGFITGKDADKPLWEDFWKTDAGMGITGNWEMSICRITPDVSSTVSMIMNPSGTGIGMWMKGEYTQIKDRPDEAAPEKLYDLYLYKMTLSVMPSGLTPNAGKENCDDKLAFSVNLYGEGGVSEQVDLGKKGDATDDIAQLTCKDPPMTYSGTSALIWSSKVKYNRVCIRFVDSNLAGFISEKLDSCDGGKCLCSTLVESGSPADLGCTVKSRGLAHSYSCPTASGEKPQGSQTAPNAPIGQGVIEGQAIG